MFSVEAQQPAQKYSTDRQAIDAQRQQHKMDSLEQVDFLAYPYVFLTKEYRMVIDEALFKATMTRYRFIPERIRTYRDSLSVVLMAEFDDWDAAHIAHFHITYSWERAGFHVLKAAKDACSKS